MHTGIITTLGIAKLLRAKDLEIRENYLLIKFSKISIYLSFFNKFMKNFNKKNVLIFFEKKNF